MPYMGFLLRDLADYLRKEGHISEEKHRQFTKSLKIEQCIIAAIISAFGVFMWWLVLCR